jgi:hypothetical protein
MFHRHRLRSRDSGPIAQVTRRSWPHAPPEAPDVEVGLWKLASLGRLLIEPEAALSAPPAATYSRWAPVELSQ